MTDSHHEPARRLPMPKLRRTGTSTRAGDGIERRYAAADVERLRGIVQVEHTLARLGAEKLWELLHTRSRSSTRSAR